MTHLEKIAFLAGRQSGKSVSLEQIKNLEDRGVKKLTEEFKPVEGDIIPEIAVGDKVYYNVRLEELEGLIEEVKHKIFGL